MENVCLFISIVLFMITNNYKVSISKILEYFISIVLFYNYKFSKIGIPGNGDIFFA